MMNKAPRKRGFLFPCFFIGRGRAPGNTYRLSLTRRRVWALNERKSKNAGRIIVKSLAIVIGVVALLAR